MNSFINLPMPAGNGPGPAIDVSALGWWKTVVATGMIRGASVTVEASVDGGVTFAPIKTFTEARGYLQQGFAANSMRAVVKGFSSIVPFSAEVNVGGAVLLGGQFAPLPMPAGDGPGVAVDVSTFPDGFTFIVGGHFPGTSVDIEISEDGGLSFVPIKTFNGHGGLVAVAAFSPQFARVFVRGRRNPAPFTATAAVGAVSGSTGATPVPGSGRELLPEIWSQNVVPAGQAATPLAAQVSQLFDDYMVIREGSTVGLGVRFTGDVTQGTATAEVTIDGIGTGLTVVVGAGSSAGRITQLQDLDSYAAGARIGVTLATSANFLPNATLNVEATVEVDTE